MPWRLGFRPELAGGAQNAPQTSLPEANGAPQTILPPGRQKSAEPQEVHFHKLASLQNPTSSTGWRTRKETLPSRS
jgi:hypothetical protein